MSLFHCTLCGCYFDSQEQDHAMYSADGNICDGCMDEITNETLKRIQGEFINGWSAPQMNLPKSKT